MLVGLIDVDSYKGYPNFALMKVAAYYKKQKAKVEWVNKANYYDVVFASKIFTFTKDYDYSGLKAGKIYKGGTGYDATVKLPPEIDSYNRLDYSIYPDCKFSLQFFTRGCVNNCPFCIVRKKEGYLHPVKPVPLNRNGQWIDVLDNNFFAAPDWKKSVAWLRKRNQPVNFRGVDVRLLTDEQAKELNTLKIKNGICIAWDNPKQDLEPVLAHLVTLIKPYKLRCYVLVGFNSTVKEDLHRIYTLQKYNILPYVMVYKDYDNPQEKTPYQKDLARWANNVFVYKKCPDFSNYSPRNGFKCSSYLEGVDIKYTDYIK